MPTTSAVTFGASPPERYAQGTNVVLLDPDVAEIFPDSEAVNRAVRALAGIIRDQQSHKPAA